MFFNPLTWDYQAWRLFFGLSAIWNFLGALNIIWPQKGFKSFFGKEANDEITLILYQLLWILVFVFGVSYLIIAYDPSAHLGIVVTGIIGKLLAGIAFLNLYQRKIAQKPARFAATGDMLFSLFFILYLFGGDRSP